jgi:hypothetical protein
VRRECESPSFTLCGWLAGICERGALKNNQENERFNPFNGRPK